jgi:hypothetical protein
MNELFSPENIKFVLYFLGGLITIISTGLAIQWRYYRQKTENLQNLHKAEIANVTAKHNKECAELQQKSIDEAQKLKEALEKEYNVKKSELLEKADIPLVQEVKMVYVKYLHIRRESEDPVYKKHLNRLEETIDVHSEYHYYRFNKYSTKNNSIQLTDRSSGVVDQNILYPWKELTFTDIPSKKIKGMITKRHWGMTHAVVKGKAKVESEYRLAAIAYNLLRTVQILGVKSCRNSYAVSFLVYGAYYGRHGVLVRHDISFFRKLPVQHTIREEAL